MAPPPRSGAGTLERAVLCATLLSAALLALNLSFAQSGSQAATAADTAQAGVRAAEGEQSAGVNVAALPRSSGVGTFGSGEATHTIPRPASEEPAPAEPGGFGASRLPDPADWRCERRLELLGLAQVREALDRRSYIPKLRTLPFAQSYRVAVAVPPRLSAVPVPTADCVFFAFFHFDKAGGTVFREYLDRLQPRCAIEKDPLGRLGFCGAPAFVRLPEHNFSFWAEGGPSVRAALPRVWIEVHSGKFHERLEQVQALRARLGGACRVLTAAAIREPVAQLQSAYRYWALGQNGFEGTLIDYVLNLGSLESAPPGFPGQEGPRADWFLGRVKFSMLERPAAHGGAIVDLNPCNQPRGGGCGARCYSLINGFLSKLDIVAPTEEWETMLLHVGSELGLTRLPLHYKPTQCLTLVYRKWNASLAAAARGPPGSRHGTKGPSRLLSGSSSPRPGGGAAGRADAQAALRAALLPSVPCSARLYAEWRGRYVRTVAARMWAERATRESVCALEAQYTCHLHHGTLDEAEGVAMHAAVGTLRNGVAAPPVPRADKGKAMGKRKGIDGKVKTRLIKSPYVITERPAL